MVAEDTQAVLEETMDVIEDTLDLMERRLRWFQKPAVKISFSGAIGLAIGASVTYLLVAKKLETKYERIADAEIKDVKEHYSILYKEGDYADLERLAARHPSPVDPVETSQEKVTDILKENGYTAYEKIEPAPDIPATDTDEPVDPEPELPDEGMDEPVVHLFSSDDPDTYWDWEEESQRRELNPDKPYVITLDEFNVNNPDFNQITLTYYEGDETLTDDHDKPLDDDDMYVGAENLLRFGHASNDRNVVYVCNPRLEAYFEIIRDEGKYAEKVLGFIEHSHQPQRRFRNHDD